MKNYDEMMQVRDEKAREFINKVATGDLDPDIREAEIMSYKIGFREAVTEFALPRLIDALTDAYKAIDSLPDDALGRVRPPGRFEEYPAKYELVHNIRKALKKAGVEL